MLPRGDPAGVKTRRPPMYKAITPMLATALLGLCASDAAAAPLKLSATPTTIKPGGSVLVKYVVKRRPAKLVLRLDGKRARTVRVRKEARGRTTVTVPPNAAPGV